MSTAVRRVTVTVTDYVFEQHITKGAQKRLVASLSELKSFDNGVEVRALGKVTVW